MKSLNVAEMLGTVLGTVLSPVVQWRRLLITCGMLLCELPCVLLFLLKKHMFGVILKSFISPLSFTAVANNWRPEPCTGPSAERPAAHRVGTAPPFLKKKKNPLGHFFARLSNILLCVCLQARGWNGAFLGCIGSLLASHVQAEHRRGFPHGHGPQRQHEPKHRRRVAAVQEGAAVQQPAAAVSGSTSQC